MIERFYSSGELGQTQNQRQTQQLMVTPQMQQALTLLQLPLVELESALDHILEQNPLLERGEWQEERTPREEEVGWEEGGIPNLPQDSPTEIIERTHVASPSLYLFLMEQAEEVLSSEEDRSLASLLIGDLDERGFLSTSLPELAIITEVPLDKLQRVLLHLQRLLPPGLFAKDLQESLLLQLQRRGREGTLAYRLVQEYFPLLLKNQLPKISKALSISLSQLTHLMEKELSNLNFSPAAKFSSLPSTHPPPDLLILLEGEKLVIRLPEESTPDLRLNPTYLSLLEDPSTPEETKRYLEQKLASAKWLMRNLSERNQTLMKIGLLLVEWQHSFFVSSTGKLLPLTMRKMAEELGLHESTIARAVQGKTLYCPRGFFTLRAFFSSGYSARNGEEISSIAVKEFLTKLIEEEDKSSPLSDEKLSLMIQKKGIPCARRTVTKYRAQLQIPSARVRQRYPR